MGKQWKQCQTILGGSKITGDGDWNHEIKRYLLLGRKVMSNLDSTLKSIDITLPTKVHLVKTMIFPVVMYGCESWSIKKAKHWRTDAFEMWCRRRLLRVTWTTRRSNQSGLISLRIDWKNWCWSWCSNPLVTWGKNYLLEETLMLGKIEGRRRRGQLRMRWLDGITDSMDLSLSNSGSWWWTGKPGVLQSMVSQRVGHDWLTELNWTEGGRDLQLILYSKLCEAKSVALNILKY